MILVVVAVLGGDVADEIDVLIGVEGGHVLLCCVVFVELGVLHVLYRGGGYDCVEVVVELVFFYYLVGHGYSEGFHGVGEGVVVGADHVVEVIHHVFFEVHHFM